jgi:hypothetical protein
MTPFMRNYLRVVLYLLRIVAGGFAVVSLAIAALLAASLFRGGGSENAIAIVVCVFFVGIGYLLWFGLGSVVRGLSKSMD